MALETASYVANLVSSNPDGGDQRSTADDHIRLLKASLLRTFPKLDSAVSLSAAQVMYLNDLSASVQLQLNQLRDGSATANNALNSRFANSASLALYANSASFAVNAGYAQSASYANLAGTAVTSGYAQSASYAALAGTATTAVTATNATNATNATVAAAANFATSAGSSALLSGLAPSDAAGGNTIAQRNSSGYLFAAYFNQSSSNNENPTPSQVMVTNGSDDYLRKSSVANLGANMAAQNISGRSGTTKTLSTSLPSGGSNGDIWYVY
jgi:hypothetical protein